MEAMGDERLIKPENIQLKDVPEVALEPEPSSSKAAATRATSAAPEGGATPVRKAETVAKAPSTPLMGDPAAADAKEESKVETVEAKRPAAAAAVREEPKKAEAPAAAKPAAAVPVAKAEPAAVANATANAPSAAVKKVDAPAAAKAPAAKAPAKAPATPEKKGQEARGMCGVCAASVQIRPKSVCSRCNYRSAVGAL